MSLLHRFLVPALILALPATAAEKRAFHIEDLYRLKGVQHLALSPDGSKLAFRVSSQDLKASTWTTQLWLLEVATGQVKQLTFSGKSDTAPQWSKDGKTLTFLSSRSGGSQLWALDASGGEARKVTSFEAGVGAPKLLPGGGKVVFEASVFPEAMTDSARHKELSDKLDNGPVQAHLADELLYRHWQRRRLPGTATCSRPPSKARLRRSPGQAGLPGFRRAGTGAPMEKEVCVTTNTDAVQARSTNQDLFLISLEGDRTPRRITADNPAADQDPQYSPDGRYIAYKFQVKPGHESDRFRLAVYDRQAKTPRRRRKASTTGWTASSGRRTARPSGSRCRRRADGRCTG